MPALPNDTARKLPDAASGKPQPGNPQPVPPARGNQESTHNKHNDGGQEQHKHKPQKHSPAEEGH